MRYPSSVSDHYFSSQPSSEASPRSFSVTIRGREFAVATAPGVFSFERLDKGTRVLLDKVPEPHLDSSQIALDLGCGWGAISLALAAETSAQVWSVDVNERARELTDTNMRASGFEPHIFSPEEAMRALDGKKVDLIWSNPPVRIGKAALHELLLTWMELLSPHGVAYIVVQKNLGADSLATWLRGEGYTCEKIGSSGGFRVFALSHSVVPTLAASSA